jgi:hypothetical protein
MANLPKSLKFPLNARFGAIFRFIPLILLGVLSLCQPAVSQQVSAALLPPVSAAMEPLTTVTVSPPKTLSETSSHGFWDRENTILFASSAAFSAADFVLTKDNLHGGGQELNPVTRAFAGNTTTLALNFAGETAGVIGLSYFFHKTGHHKMERAVSLLNTSASGAAVTFDLAHR